MDQKARTKGFAFVWMLSKKDAEKAIDGCNGMVVRAGMADGMVSDKQKKKKQRRVEKKMTAVAVETQGGEEGGEKTMEVVDDKRATERVIAVDWALSKQKWTEEKAKTEGGDVDEDVHMEDADAASAEDSEDGSEDSDEDGDLGVHKGGDRSSDRDDSDNEINGDDAEDKPVKPQLPPPETGTTLFLRNVPFTATEDELRTLYVFPWPINSSPHLRKCVLIMFSTQLPYIWTPAIYSDHLGWCHGSLSWNRICMLLE